MHRGRILVLMSLLAMACGAPAPNIEHTPAERPPSLTNQSWRPTVDGLSAAEQRTVAAKIVARIDVLSAHLQRARLSRP